MQKIYKNHLPPKTTKLKNKNNLNIPQNKNKHPQNIKTPYPKLQTPRQNKKNIRKKTHIPNTHHKKAPEKTHHSLIQNQNQYTRKTQKDIQRKIKKKPQHCQLKKYSCHLKPIKRYQITHSIIKNPY
jgi:hypothetical protein